MYVNDIVNKTTDILITNSQRPESLNLYILALSSPVLHLSSHLLNNFLATIILYVSGYPKMLQSVSCQKL